MFMIIARGVNELLIVSFKKELGEIEYFHELAFSVNCFSPGFLAVVSVFFLLAVHTLTDSLLVLRVFCLVVLPRGRGRSLLSKLFSLESE